jgi:hypothetical protein
MRHRPCLNTNNRRAAEARLTQIIADLNRGLAAYPTKTPVGRIVGEFISHLYAHHREQAVGREIHRLREFFGPVCPALESGRLKVGHWTKRPKGKLG